MQIAVREIQFFEIPITFLKPFRFGAFSLSACPQVFTRVVVEVPSRGWAEGVSAELAVPRWFDKRPDVDPVQNVSDLFAALRLAKASYLAVGQAQSLFHLHGLVDKAMAVHVPHLPALVRSFGLAQIEKAIMDAICRLTQSSFPVVTKANLWGIQFSATEVPDLQHIDASGSLALLAPRNRLWLRHTVGFPDTDDAAERQAELSSLGDQIKTQGLRFLKIKLSGSPAMDSERVAEICSLFSSESLPDFTLDCNEQYPDEASLMELCERLGRIPLLGGVQLGKKCLFLEQPLAREKALDGVMRLDILPVAVVIDESDDADDSFFLALQCGYRGVSSKACKGVIRSLINIIRCADRNAGSAPRYFVTPEDLCTQPGWALQQDLAIAALTGSIHVEKNGHQYVDSFSGVPAAISQRLYLDHPDLYSPTPSTPRLRIEDGCLSFASVNESAGFGTSVLPDFNLMQEVR